MKILILSRGVPNSHDPQEGCFELDQAKALKKAGHEVVIMAVDSRIRKFWRNPGVEKRIVDGITTYKLFTLPTSIIRRLISFKIGVNIEANEAKWLYKYVTKREGSFDVIHAHFLTSIFYAARIKQKFDIPVIGTEHWSKVNVENPSSDVLYMGNKAYGEINQLISVSKSLRQRILENFKVDSLVVYNLIDITYLQPVNRNKNNNKFTIILVGSLIKRKGFDFFIKALAKSCIIKENLTVKIIGSGTEHSYLQNLIKSLGLSNKVELLGQLAKKDIFCQLNNAHLFVLPSRNENFSVSVLEALVNGLPVIATICGGIRECIDSSNGMLVEIDNEAMMVEALERMYANYYDYNPEAISSKALAEYSPSNISNTLSSLYERITNKTKNDNI